MGEIITVPSWAVLIDHPRAKIVVDTGFGNPSLPHVSAWNGKRSEKQELEHQLKEYGFKPELVFRMSLNAIFI